MSITQVGGRRVFESSSVVIPNGAAQADLVVGSANIRFEITSSVAAVTPSMTSTGAQIQIPPVALGTWVFWQGTLSLPGASYQINLVISGVDPASGTHLINYTITS